MMEKNVLFVFETKRSSSLPLCARSFRRKREHFPGFSIGNTKDAVYYFIITYLPDNLQSFNRSSHRDTFSLDSTYVNMSNFASFDKVYFSTLMSAVVMTPLPFGSILSNADRICSMRWPLTVGWEIIQCQNPRVSEAVILRLLNLCDLNYGMVHFGLNPC